MILSVTTRERSQKDVRRQPVTVQRMAVTKVQRRQYRHRLDRLVIFSAILNAFQPGTSDGFSIAAHGKPQCTWWSGACRGSRSATRTTTIIGLAPAESRGEVPSTHIEELRALTVVHLKKELKERGLKQVGNKEDLVRRLADALLTTQSAERVGASLNPADGSAQVSRGQANTVPARSPLVEAEEVLGDFPADTPSIASAVTGETIMDAELASSPALSDAEMAGRADENDVHGLGMDEDDYSSSSPFGDELDDPVRAGNVPDGFQQVRQEKTDDEEGLNGGSPLPSVPLLGSATEDMKKRRVIMDQLERREARFELKDDIDSGLLPRGDVYVVSTKKALRPWDGPHADRAETHVVVLLSDVFGWEDSFTRNAADQIADVCDSIVLVPDMFRKQPWDNERPDQEYEAWRASHDPDIVASDIRDCVDFARSEYRATSVGLVGFCYGGGRALEEAAAGRMSFGANKYCNTLSAIRSFSFQGIVEPDTVVVFYPTRYDINKVGSGVACPVAAFFAEDDDLPGATVTDARYLREQLFKNDKVPDAQVKMCPSTGHGFVHRPMKKDKENAEDAMLLATSWLEMYMHKHYRIQGRGLKEEEFGFWDLPPKDNAVA